MAASFFIKFWVKISEKYSVKYCDYLVKCIILYLICKCYPLSNHHIRLLSDP